MNVLLQILLKMEEQSPLSYSGCFRWIMCMCLAASLPYMNTWISLAEQQVGVSTNCKLSQYQFSFFFPLSMKYNSSGYYQLEQWKFQMNTFKSLLFPCDIVLLSFVPGSFNQMDAFSFLFGLLMYSSPLWGFYQLRYLIFFFLKELHDQCNCRIPIIS